MYDDAPRLFALEPATPDRDEPGEPTMSLPDRVELALELSADDPDGEHPEWVRQALAISTRRGWADEPKPASRPMIVARGHQVELDLFAAVDDMEPTPEERLDVALGFMERATRAKGSLPSEDDCHRRRYGLPGMSVFNAAGGWVAVVVRFRAERFA